MAAGPHPLLEGDAARANGMPEKFWYGICTSKPCAKKIAKKSFFLVDSLKSGLYNVDIRSKERRKRKEENDYCY
jgi:hypothetical protein